MTVSQITAEYMAKRLGIIAALEEARKYKDNSNLPFFWTRVITWLETYATQAAAMHELT